MGFTLIELLAVIVILAIISLIAIPVILNIINDVQEESEKRSIEMYADAVKNAVARHHLTNPTMIEGTFTQSDNGKKIIQEGKSPVEIDYDGNVECGVIEVYDDGTIYMGGCTVNGSNNKYVYNKTVQLLEPTESFEKDSWETILYNVKSKNLTAYKVGETKEIALIGFTNGELDSNGLYTIRIANISSDDSVCTLETNEAGEAYSKTACGFVIEFVDIITEHNMNPAGEYKEVKYDSGWNVDGYPVSSMHTFIKTNIYNSLPENLRDIIINTKVISSHGSTTGETNFTSIDKLYLLSTKEVYGKEGGSKITHDTAWNETRQLDFYKNYKNPDGSVGVTKSNYSGAIKNYNGNAYYWWLRTARSNYDNLFYRILPSGDTDVHYANDIRGVAPAFRIG